MAKRFMSFILDPNRDLTDRTFLLMSTITYIVLGVIFIWDIIIGETALKLAFLGGALVLMAIFMLIAVTRKMVQPIATLICVIMIFVLLPVEFFTGGAVNGCTPIWYAYSFMYAGVNLKGRKRIVLILSIPVSAIICYWLAYKYPYLVTVHNPTTGYLDSIASLIGVGIMLYFIVTFLIRIFLKENEIAKSQKEEIEELNKSQNRFFSSMSHEIRTPINTIIGLNELTLRDEEISSDVAENALNIQSASKMLLTTINDILDMSKIESGKMEIVPVEYDVGNMLSEIVNMIWARCREKGLEFHIDVDRNMPRRLFGDEIRIKQILINILNNAIKYTNAGSVTLQVQCTSTESRERVRLNCFVEDTGIGIKKENIPHLFEAFRRVDLEQNRQVEGTGLGLSIVKQLVDLMDGEISVNSIYTKGSTFMITLEQGVVDSTSLGELGLSTRHTLNAREHYRVSFEAPKGKVLIVDDNEANLMVEAKLLKDTKISIDTADSGKECLEKTKTTAYHCIFMDHLMPGMDGIECLRAIRSQPGGLNRETPVIVLTANAGMENMELYKKSGFDGYLLKPVTGPMLETTLIKQLPKDLVHLTDAEFVSSRGEEGLFRGHSGKRTILVTTESVCDLPHVTTEKLNIPVIPYRIFTEEGDFLDGTEVEADGIIDYMMDGNRRVSASEPSVSEYEEFFAKQLTQAQQLIHITISSQVGHGYENACEAARAFDNVTVYDSMQVSGAFGLVVLQASRLAANEKTVERVIDHLNKMRERTRSIVITKSADRLAAAGYISPQLRGLSRAFLMHPVMAVRKGRYRPVRFYLGNLERGWERFLRRELAAFPEMEDKLAIVNFVGLSYEQQQKIEKLIRTHAQFKTLVFQKASPAVSAHCGPLSFGLMYTMKK